MSQANLDLFVAKVAQDPALLSALTAGVTAPAEFVERAVSAGQEAGLPFTPAEAEAWLAAKAKTDNSGELSDTQLEGVAGGKSAFVHEGRWIINGSPEYAEFMRTYSGSTTIF